MELTMVHGSGNTSAIYRVADGVRVGGFFGHVPTGDVKLGLLAISNRDQDVTIVDMATEKTRPLRIKSSPIQMRPHRSRVRRDEAPVSHFSIAPWAVYRSHHQKGIPSPVHVIVSKRFKSEIKGANLRFLEFV
jgi:hypothetical protein